MSDGLAAVAAEVRSGGGLLAAALATEPVAEAADWGALAASGPRAGDPEGVALAVEAVREGYLLHRGCPRLFDGSDRDLALLAGDRLYALGLAGLARAGNLEAVAELAAVIACCAHAAAAGDEELAEAAWEAGATGIGWGRSPGLAQAWEAARAGEPGAAGALRDAARQERGDLAQMR
ncbi:MAG: hypothetical protein ACKOB9_00800 [Solirubrobacterales bacterium]